MKSIYMAVFVALGLLLMASCSEKKKSENIIAPKPVVVKPKAPVRMQGFNHSEKVEWAGGEYTAVIKRNIDDGAPLFEDENGNKYYENRIDLSIIRPDGTEFFHRQYTKHSFDSYVDADYMQRSTLLGISVLRTTSNELELLASVGCPDELSDDYVPISIILSRDGNVTMKKSSNLGVSNNPHEESEDGV